MTEYDKVDRRIESHLCLRVNVSVDGELTPEQLEDIDDEMLKVGANRTGQRVGVTSTERQHSAEVEYVYQETLLHQSISNVEERLQVIKGFDDAYVIIDSKMVEFSG